MAYIQTIGQNSGTWSADDELARAEEYAKMYSDALDIQYAAGIQNLTEQKQNLPATYDPYRAGVNAQYERSMRTNNETMANLGLNRSGTNLTNQIKLSNERARGMAEVDSNQAKAIQEVQAQINQYIADRDSAKAQERATAYQNAYNNISQQQRTLAQMEQQNKYDVQLAELDYAHDEEMARLNHQYAIAEMNNDYAKKAQLEREMAALDYSYSMQKLERQQQLENESYAERAATDWDYYQQQAALDSKLSLDEYASKAATDWSYYQKQAALNSKNNSGTSAEKTTTNKLTGKTISKYSDLGDDALALYQEYNTRMQRSKDSMNTQVRNLNASTTLAAIESAFNAGRISETEADWLIRLWGLDS